MKSKVGVFCQHCSSGNVVSYGKSWKCKDCNRYFVKNPKKQRRGWSQWNKGLTKETSQIVAGYAEKQSETKRQQKYVNIAIQNLPPPKIDVSKEELEELYNKPMTQLDIANGLGISQGRVAQLMKKFGIKARPKSADFRVHKMKEEFCQKISERMRGNINWRFSHQFPNKEEQKLIRFFNRWNLPFKYVGDASFRIEGKCPDFIWKEKQAIIEFFGELWHKESDELKRIKFFEEYGWHCLIIWGKEIGRYQKGKRYSWERRLYDKILRWLAGLP